MGRIVHSAAGGLWRERNASGGRERGRVARCGRPHDRPRRGGRAQRAGLALAALACAALVACVPGVRGPRRPLPAGGTPGASGAVATAGATRDAAGARAPADRIFRGGPILTVDAQDRVARALAVRGGRIAAVGDEREVMRLQGPATEVVDLAGHALAPGFIDAHGHVVQVGRMAATANLAAPPVGKVTSIADLQATLRDYIAAHALAPGAAVVGSGYDDALLAEHRHPTRDDLDAVSTEHPIVVLHASLHLASANSAALAKAGIDASTPDPAGGVFHRRAGSREPDGVAEESAMWALFASLPRPTPERALGMLSLAQQTYARGGFTTLQEGAAGPEDFALLRAAAERPAGEPGALELDVNAYAVSHTADALLEASPIGVGERVGRLRLAGMKVVLDGSPQGRTAWLSEPYFVPPPGRGADYVGYPAMDDAALTKLLTRYYVAGWQVLAHANGDAAAEQLLRVVAAVEQANEGPAPDDWRPVMIHAQMLRDDQLARMPALGMIASFFVAHTFYWGDWHRDTVMGPERAARISPTAAALRYGVRFTLHDDAPVVPPDGVFLMWTAVNRLTRSGRVLGPQQRISAAQALRAITADAAYQGFEERDKGSLEVGKRADLVVLSRNPLAVAPAAIRDIAVLETIKDGRSVYRAAQ